MFLKRLLEVGCCLAFAALTVRAQPPTPRPGPEHEALRQFVGDWDATLNSMGNQSKGTARYRMGLGGFFLLVDFRADLGGMPFEGKGATGYDPTKKKYVGMWMDSMDPYFSTTEGAFAKDGKTYTATGENTGGDGKPVKVKVVYHFKDRNTMIFTKYEVVDGKDQEPLTISYRRKK